MAKAKEPITQKSGLDPARFQTPKFATVAADLLRDLILDGTFAPGERLNEVALSERLQISRSPIREALRALSGQGLVTMVANRGAYVQTYSMDMLRELGAVREILDCAAASLAATQMTPDQLRVARSLADKISHSLEVHPDSRAKPQKNDFHAMVAEGSGNAELAAIIRTVESKFMIARARSGADPENARVAHMEHLEILHGLLDHDSAAAAAAMRSHLSSSLERMLKTLA
jgi:GntR family transcriptional regulator, rspAB operon transcriptional repressor